MKVAKKHIEDAIELVKKSLMAEDVEIDDDDEETGDSGTTLLQEDLSGLDENSDRAEDLAASTQMLSRARIPIEEWDSIRVSPASLFGHDTWDFTAYPLPYERLGRCPTLPAGVSSPDNPTLARIVKGIAFYRIPHFSVSNYSSAYSSMPGAGVHSRRMYAALAKRHLYTGSPHSPRYRTIDDLTQDEVEEIINEPDSANIRYDIAYWFTQWQFLTQSGMLPRELGCHTEFVAKAYLSEKAQEAERATVGFQPLPLDAYAALILHSHKLVAEYAEDALWLYRTFYPSLSGSLHDPARAALLPGGHTMNSRAGCTAFNAYEPAKIAGKPWWSVKVMQRVNPVNSRSVDWEFADKNYTGYVSIKALLASISSVCDAGVVILLATTGMRGSDLANLSANCLLKDQDGYWLTYKVYKTSPQSRGYKKKIPIPEITAKAVMTLDELCRPARQYGKHDRLLAGIYRQSFGMVVAQKALPRMLSRQCEAAGIEIAHPHQLRKSLAMYLIYRDPRSLQLIKHLYSHASLKMTLKYILQLPGVHREIVKAMIEQNTEILATIIEAAMNNKIGGFAGKRAKKAIESNPHFAAQLMDDGKESLAAYVESLLYQGASLLHRTNFAICMRTGSIAQKAPCDINKPGAKLSLVPNISACDPLDCRHAAFLEEHMPALQNAIIFHQKWAIHPYASDSQRAFSEHQIRKAFERLAEVDADSAEAFMLEVANG